MGDSLENRIARLEKRLPVNRVDDTCWANFGMSKLRVDESGLVIVKARDVWDEFPPEPPAHFDASERIGFFKLFEAMRTVRDKY